MDEEVTCIEEQISLVCPLKKSRIKVPVKGSNCLHRQCFDQAAYKMYEAQMLSFARQPQCPVCSNPIKEIQRDVEVEVLLSTCGLDIHIFTIGQDNVMRPVAGGGRKGCPNVFLVEDEEDKASFPVSDGARKVADGGSRGLLKEREKKRSGICHLKKSRKGSTENARKKRVRDVCVIDDSPPKLATKARVRRGINPLSSSVNAIDLTSDVISSTTSRTSTGGNISSGGSSSVSRVGKKVLRSRPRSHPSKTVAPMLKVVRESLEEKINRRRSRIDKRMIEEMWRRAAAD